MGSSTDNWHIWNEFTAGNQKAMLQLYEEHYVNLMNYGLKITNDRDFTNDCLMDMLLDLWDKRQTLPPVNNIRGYLTTCLRRTIFKKYKQQKWESSKMPAMLFDAEQHDLPFEDILTSLQTNENLKNQISKGFQNLTDRQKELLRLKFFEDYSYDEIAIICNISKRTAYNIVYDALKVLKKSFEKGKINITTFELSILIFNFLLLHEKVLS